MVVAPQNSDIENDDAIKNDTSDTAMAGLDFIVENKDYVEKLHSALESDNAEVKKQVFELLSALCVHNTEGYNRTFECLDSYKVKTGERYRFKFIIKELQNATTSDYQTAILAFINCLILSTHDIRDRIRIRSEFVGLKLLHVLHNLRSKQHSDLIVQLDVFDEQKESDESQGDSNAIGIDLSSPLEVFEEILRQIADTPQEIPFLCILQHLLRIESKEAISDIIWDTAERLVHRATLLESRKDALTLLNAQGHSKSLSKLKGSTNGDKCSCQCHQKESRASSSTSNSFMNTTTTTVEVEENRTIIPPPPLPQSSPIPPPPPKLPGAPTFPNGVSKLNLPKLAQQEIPTPKTKMRTINWNKISSGQILHGNQNNLWATLGKTHANNPISLDWGTLEGLFCLSNEKSNDKSNSINETSGYSYSDKSSSKRDQEIILLDAKRSLNINIFLKQFRRSNEELIKLIEDGSSEEFGSEKLRGLLKILPLKDETEMLKCVSESDKPKLASAERFLLRLMEVRGYQLRIEAMLLKDELDPCISNIESSINTIFQASNDVQKCVELQEIIFMILVAGNFLNSGGYAGDAAGLKLSSLQKIADIRGNKPGISLLHFIAMQAESKNPSLISFVNDLALEEASKINIEQLKCELTALRTRVSNINEQLERPNTAHDAIQQFCEFFKNAKMQVQSLETSFSDIEKTRLELANFFCEEVTNFKLEDCFKTLYAFTTAWKNAAFENERRRTLEKEVEARRLTRESQLRKRQQISTQDNLRNSKILADQCTQNIETGGISHASPKPSKRRFDCNGNANGIHEINDLQLPKVITPTGSLRRRRRPEESEDKLITYLIGSTEDNPRERTGHGDKPLDRSAFRSSRRRANLSGLLNYDRERASSSSSYGSCEKNSGQIETSIDDFPSTAEEISSWSEDRGDVEAPKNYTNASQTEDNKQADRLSTCGLAALREEELPKSNNTRRPSLQLNTDVVGAMEAIEEAHGLTKEGLRRKHSVTQLNQNSRINSANSSSDESARRRSFIGSLGTKAHNDKLVLYINQPSPVSKKMLFRHGSTGEEQSVPKSPDATKSNRSIFGTDEGFNRFASIRRSRKFKNSDFSSTLNQKVSKADGTSQKATINQKIPSDRPANKLKQLFTTTRLPDPKTNVLRPFNRSHSIETSRNFRDSFIQKVKRSASINEADEGFEESQSSLPETNTQITPKNIPVSKVSRQPSRRGGFREGREALSTRSIVAAQRALQQNKQPLPEENHVKANGKLPSKSNSRISLLSSRGSHSGASTVKEGISNEVQTKLSKSHPIRPALTQSSTSVNRRGSKAIGTSNSKPEESSVRNNIGKTSEKGSQPSTKKILRFMRPTASSSARGVNLPVPSKRIE